MRIGLFSFGTRGDLQPFLLLALALRDAGHEVRVVGAQNFRAWIERTGIPFFPIGVDAEAVLHHDETKRALATGDVLAFLRVARKHDAQHSHVFERDVIAAGEGLDAIVANALVFDRAAALGAARRIPVVGLQTFPIIPSSTYASPMLRGRPLPFGFMNRLSHAVFERAFWSLMKPGAQAMRKTLGVAPAKEGYWSQCMRRGIPTLAAHSPVLFPTPQDWPSNVVVTGAFPASPALREAHGEAEPSAALRRWLDAGPPPLYFGLGSIPVLDPARMLALVRSVVTPLGLRGIIGAGWTKLVPADGDAALFVVGAVDHDWLLPRCAAAVHHGGAGTTMAVARAGIPAVVCSVFGDQPWWGARVEALGAGITFPYAKLDEERLHDAVVRVLDAKVRARAKEIGDAVRDEDGLPVAVEALERLLPTAPIPE